MADNEQLLRTALDLLHTRDMRFYNSMDVYNGKPTNAGEMMRLASREPFLDHDGAAVLVAATEEYAFPNFTAQEFHHFIHCAKRCPKLRVAA